MTDWLIGRPMRRPTLRERAWVRLTCNWLAIAATCALRGHRWREEHLCMAMAATTCGRCGKYRGRFDKGNGREKCSRIVNDSPGRSHVEFAQYPPRARQALSDAADHLRGYASDRFAAHGPDDERGAALWDAGCFIDPDDGDALRLGRNADPARRVK